MALSVPKYGDRHEKQRLIGDFPTDGIISHLSDGIKKWANAA